MDQTHPLLTLLYKYRYLVYTILLIPIFAVRDFTPANELKYISIIEESVKDRTWFVFTNHGEYYADKPPLWFWLVKLTRLITGGYPSWILGLFSVLPAVGILAVCDRWFKRTSTSHNPITSNLLLLTTAIFAGGTLVLRMDMLMTLFIVLSLYTYFKIYRGENTKTDLYLFPLWIFLAVFSKGPVGFMMPVVSIIAFSIIKRNYRILLKVFGLRTWLVLIGLCTIWFSATFAEGGNEYLNDLLFRQTVGRGIDSFHHKENFFFYFRNLYYSFAPWILLYIVMLVKGFRKSTQLDDTQKFFLTAALSNFLVMSFVSSKIDIYLLPIYPFVVYYCSSIFHTSSKNGWINASVAIPAAIIFLILPGAMIFRDKLPFGSGYMIAAWVPVVILFISALWSFMAAIKGRAEKAVVLLGSGILVTLTSAVFAVPPFNKYIGYGEMALDAKKYGIDNGYENYAYYKFPNAPNMDAYLGQKLVRINTAAELDSLAVGNVPVIVFIRYKELNRENDLPAALERYTMKGEYGKYWWYVNEAPDPSAP